MDNISLYEDIKARTGGEIYLGVVGPVRTGKSTFIRRFMDLCVIPSILDPNEKKRIIDELPQAGVGKTVMTTEPKFIPKTGIEIPLSNNVKAKFRLIDCVGYIVDSAQGVYEDDKERLVKTPWFDENIPFSKAAQTGTEKVIRDHSTIGIVMTTDGSIGEFTRDDYISAEEKAIMELKKIKKPFIVIVNSTFPASDFTRKIANEISEKYEVTALPMDCENLNKEDVNKILSAILYEFPIDCFNFNIPDWTECLKNDNPVKAELIENAADILQKITCVKDISKGYRNSDKNRYITSVKINEFDFNTGILSVDFELDEKLYYEHLSNLTGENIEDEYALIELIRRLSKFDKEFNGYNDAINVAKNKGYGVVVPGLNDVKLYDPEIIKNGNKYGVKLKAESPSLHMIKVNIGTEISPIVGSKEQAEDLMAYIKESTKEGNVWETNIFGKTIGNLVEEGISAKIQTINDDCQMKLIDTMQKVVNETSNGIICLIL